MKQFILTKSIKYNTIFYSEFDGVLLFRKHSERTWFHMATIDLIVLGILKKEPMSAYDIQKLVEYRNISKWVKISTPSIYKKAIQLEEKGLIRGEIVKEGKMPEKVIYSLTDAGEAEFERLMFEISEKPINIFLDFNAVIVNLDSLPPEKQKSCIAEIEENISTLKSYLEYNIQKKENEPSIQQQVWLFCSQQYVLGGSNPSMDCFIKRESNKSFRIKTKKIEQFT